MALAGRTILITGANGGLGRVAARAFAAQGARLALVSRDTGKLEALAQELALPAERLLLHPTDLREASAAQATVQAVLEWAGRLDVLIHLVGGWTGGKTLVEAPAGDLEGMLAQHLWTSFHLAQACLPHMTAAGWGRLIVVSSPLAMRPAAASGPYAIAKAAQETLFLTLAQELQNSGVTANVVQVRGIDVEHARQLQPSPKNASSAAPEEIVAAMLYLCTDEAGLLNGARLPLFGAPA